MKWENKEETSWKIRRKNNNKTYARFFRDSQVYRKETLNNDLKLGLHKYTLEYVCYVWYCFVHRHWNFDIFFLFSIK